MRLRERASTKIERGDFLRVPYIGGTTANEGTFFSSSVRLRGLSGQAETDAFVNYIENLVIDNSTLTNNVVSAFVEQYPANDPTAGAPFTTGDSLFDRTAAFYTNEMFLSVRRFFFQHAAARQPMFAFIFREFIPGNDISKGVTHGMELELFFGPPSLPANASIDSGLQTQMRDFYINFVNDLNPGPQWEPFNPRSPRVLQLQSDNVTMIPDDWDSERVDFCNSLKVMAEFEK
ncbi:hypothetical protein D9619_004770 [Psilocybe cf. subviscida]|uniref:Carboxylesterase type B domain-containing protein n=1 Tax=Psilocybe cf. subviscida TaxID=2480587 RepID=A0A8H5F8Q4_9AGAR|nr:hypothetical protein D9619_004770 [Psilocybe cf. subviscida]